MKKISASLALGLLSQHVYAAGFIEDSKASLGLRNFYINQDTRNADGATQEEWG
ncbi:MAG: outer membrane porin, OprD family, partial [Pseudomonas sp.]